MDHPQDTSQHNAAFAETSNFENINIPTESSASEFEKHKIDVIQSDRDLPKFLQDEMEEVLGISHSNRHSSFHSTGVQTCVSGVKKISNFLYTTDFGHPVAVMNSSVSPKDPSSCISFESELSLTRSQLYNVHYNYQRLKSRFHKLHEDYYKLLRVTGELTQALDNSARGNIVDLPSTLKSCMSIYPDLFSHKLRDDSTDMRSIKSEIELQQHDLTESKQPILGIVPVSSKQLDFKKIKLHLLNANVKTKLLLLQALRWKMTLSQPEERDEAVYDYTSSDLLGLHSQIPNDNCKSILPCLLIPLDVVLPHPLQQSTARLLNTLASLKCGRDYLSVGPVVLNVVIQCLDTARAETVDSLTCDMILAMLQKMSLRRQQRLYMIGMGLVEWLIYHLKAESKKIGTYRLEYTTALLMNLSLHREAQVRASTMTTLVLSTLTELLSSSHMPALPYVNGTLNNFLANRTINEEAKKIGLDSVLEYHRQRNSGEIRRHLDYILNRLRRTSTESVEDSNVMADDDNEQLDVLENELDDLDPVKVHAGELFGEALLATCYSISNTSQISNCENAIKISSSKFSNTEVHKSSEKCSSDQQDSPQRDRLISPSTLVPRLTPENRKLTRKNTSPLKVIELPDKYVGPRLASMTEKGVDTTDHSESSLESEISSDDSEYSENNSERFVHFYETDRFDKNSKASEAKSTPTWIAGHENSGDVAERMSSIASLKEKSIEKDVEDDAFVSKPRISRTPPHSAVTRLSTSPDTSKYDDDVFVE